MTTTVIIGGGYVYAEVTEPPAYKTKLGQHVLKIQGEGRFDPATNLIWIKTTKSGPLAPIPLFGDIKVIDNDKENERLAEPVNPKR